MHKIFLSRILKITTLLDVKNLFVEKLLHLTKPLKRLSTLLLQKLWNIKNERTNSWKYMDIIKIFTALTGFVKSFWRLVLLLTSCSWGRFQFISISLQAGLTDWQSWTKLETGLQVEVQMTELFALLEQTVLVTNVLTS